jgi:ABC-type amino acid transport substrate-binding protein
MQRAGSQSSRGHRVGIAAVAIALLSAAVVPLAHAAPTGALERARQAGKLTLGYRADARPFSFRDESGKAAGYSVALCEQIAEQVKAELGLATLAVDWVPVTVEDRLPAVQQGRIDLLCGAETATLARRKEVAFSIPIFPGGIGALLRADSSRRLREILSKGQAAPRPLWRASPAQILEQQTFSVVAGTTAESWLAERRATLKIPAKVAPVDGYEAGVQRVIERKSNVFFGDRAILLDAAKRSPSARDLIVLDRQFTSEPLALALARGDEDLRLIADRTLSRLFRSDEFQGLYRDWFGPPEEGALAWFRSNALPE